MDVIKKVFSYKERNMIKKKLEKMITLESSIHPNAIIIRNLKMEIKNKGINNNKDRYTCLNMLFIARSCRNYSSLNMKLNNYYEYLEGKRSHKDYYGGEYFDISLTFERDIPTVIKLWNDEYLKNYQSHKYTFEDLYNYNNDVTNRASDQKNGVDKIQNLIKKKNTKYYYEKMATMIDKFPKIPVPDIEDLF